MSLEKAAEGIVNIVNENMCGALRLVSVEQGYDPRDFALIGFGGAGPLHANALAKLINSWPVIIPPGPGVLCAYGDATTRLRDEASRTLVQRFETLSDAQIGAMLADLEAEASKSLAGDGVDRGGAGNRLSDRHALRRAGHEADGRRRRRRNFAPTGLAGVAKRFDRMHEQFFTFALDAGHELVGLRAVVQGPQKPFISRRPAARAAPIPSARRDRAQPGLCRRALAGCDDLCARQAASRAIASPGRRSSSRWTRRR